MHTYIHLASGPGGEADTGTRVTITTLLFCEMRCQYTMDDAFTEHGVIGKIFFVKKYL